MNREGSVALCGLKCGGSSCWASHQEEVAAQQ
jgi:hypothetical protein